MIRGRCWIWLLWRWGICCEYLLLRARARERADGNEWLTVYRMLIVMTFNVEYFMSVLAGSFLGSLLMGRFSTMGRSFC